MFKCPVSFFFFLVLLGWSALASGLTIVFCKDD